MTEPTVIAAAGRVSTGTPSSAASARATSVQTERRGRCGSTRAVKAFTAELPDSAAAWERGKRELRRKLWDLLGDIPPPLTPLPHLEDSEDRDGYRLEVLRFENGLGDAIHGFMLVPTGGPEVGPAVLYHHWHAGQYTLGKEELFRPVFAPSGHRHAPGEALVRAGYRVLCIDAYGFGQRQWQGPAGHGEEGRATEESLAKLFLWQGRTLWGMMLHDDLSALAYLACRPDVDPARIAAMGTSMGATRSWWAAALDERIAAVVSVGCLTRYQELIASGFLSNHGLYYYVPNVLRQRIDMETVVGLIAPRPHLTLTGDRDPTSPVEGVRRINEFQEHLYAKYGRPELYRGLVYKETAHAFTEEMWDETMMWLTRHLAADRGAGA